MIWQIHVNYILLFLFLLKPYSNHPPCINDVSLWIPEGYQENDFYDIVRSVGGNIVEKVQLVDVFSYQKLGKTSHCYRITYRSPDRPLESAEVEELTGRIRSLATSRLKVTLR